MEDNKGIDKLIDDLNKDESIREKVEWWFWYWFYRFPKDIWNDIKYGSISLIKRFSVTWSLRDWDYAFILYSELNELRILKNGIARYQNHENWKRDVETLNTAINLLEIIIGKESKTSSYVNINNSHRFLDKKTYKYVMDQLSNEDKRHDRKYLIRGLIREEKVWKIYHRYREYYMRSWWD